MNTPLPLTLPPSCPSLSFALIFPLFSVFSPLSVRYHLLSTLIQRAAHPNPFFFVCLKSLVARWILRCIYSLIFTMAATQPPPGNLKDRIASLQQRNGTPSPTSSPTLPRDASVTPPRGSLRDKIAKFERKGGVPVPRGSFAMGAPPAEDAGATKSRELYGNRVAALGKGRPTAPGNSGHRSVTSPAPIFATPNAQFSSDGNDTESSAPSSTSHTVPPSTPPERRSLSGPIDRSDEAQQDTAERTNEHQENPIQRDAVSRLAALPETDSGSSDPVISAAQITESTALLANSPSSAGPAVTTFPMGETPKRVPSAQKPILSEIVSPHVENLDRSAIYKGHATPSSVESHQERMPIDKPAVSTVQTRITVEQKSIKDDATSRGSDDSLTAPFTQSTTSAVPQLSLSSDVDLTEKLKGDTNLSASNVDKTKFDSPADATSVSNVAFPSSAPVDTHSVIGDFDDSTAMSPPPATEASRRSFSAVVHRNDTDKRPDSRHSTTSRTSTITSRPSSSSFKTGNDGGVVRSKRNFKHLGAVTADPPAAPGVGDLAALLLDAAWLEQRLSDENTTFDPSALGEEGLKAESGPGPLSATVAKTEQTTRPVPAAATATRSKGRGLTLGPLTSVPSTNTPYSPVRSSTSTPSFQVHPAASGSPEEVLPTPPKSARGRKYFSLRGVLRGSRLSMSSEMSSDDSAPVATPPSPTFDLSMPQSAQGHGNDSMSVRSMFSSRSNKSGKSESVPKSLRLSPRRSVAKASSFAERLLSRATKTKSVLDDPDDAIPERSPMLPPIIPETPGPLLSISPISGSSQTDISFDRNIFDAFPDVPSDVPQRPASYLFPVPPSANSPGNQDFRRSSTIGIPTSEKGKPDWLRTRQGL